MTAIVVIGFILFMTAVIYYAVGPWSWYSDWSRRGIHKCGNMEPSPRGELEICSKCGERGDWKNVVCRRTAFATEIKEDVK